MSYKDFETRKSLHINLTRETHAALRVCSFTHKLSMQEIFEELAMRVVEKDPYMQKVLSYLETQKKDKAMRKFSSTDAESIFRIIENENPLAADETGTT